MTCNQLDMRRSQRTGRHSEDLSFRPFEVDGLWYQSYWYDDARPTLASRLVGALAVLFARTDRLAGKLGRIRARSLPDLTSSLTLKVTAFTRPLTNVQRRPVASTARRRACPVEARTAQRYS
jgi:hypothetical protein